MKLIPITIVFAVALVSISAVSLAEDKDTDYAVPAVIDLPMLGLPQSGPQMLKNSLKEDLNPFPTPEQIRWFDINRDLQINDFDLQQFEKIIDLLHGYRLSGLQLAVRFRMAQKNQGNSFPIVYDLDRDGMFTPYDVDYFGELVHQLDRGASRANELLENFRQFQTS